MDDDLKAELAELERLAKDATRGPWLVRTLDNFGFNVVHYRNGDKFDIARVAKCPAEINARYLAAANPATVLRLISALRQRDEALEVIADVWSLPPPKPRTGKWHCQHEEMLASASETARAILTGSETNAR